MRTKPYTAIGIKRVPCSRCGKPSHASWQACADGRQYRGLCVDCDIRLNSLAMRFMRIPDFEKKIIAYAARMKGK